MSFLKFLLYYFFLRKFVTELVKNIDESLPSVYIYIWKHYSKQIRLRFFYFMPQHKPWENIELQHSYRLVTSSIKIMLDPTKKHGRVVVQPCKMWAVQCTLLNCTFLCTLIYNSTLQVTFFKVPETHGHAAHAAVEKQWLATNL